MPIFAKLEICRDATPRSAAMNMAIDEALVEAAKVPTIRFYRWKSPALSFGYFGKFADVVNHVTKRDLVRRWTGGGIVFMETISLTRLSSRQLNRPSANRRSRSTKNYTTLCAMLWLRMADARNWQRWAGTPRCGVRGQRGAPPPPMFVLRIRLRADVMVKGRKVAGAAQRRTRAVYCIKAAYNSPPDESVSPRRPTCRS